MIHCMNHARRRIPFCWRAPQIQSSSRWSDRADSPVTHPWTALAGVFQRYSVGAGRKALTDFTRLAGGLLPIPLCGRTSL